MSLKEISKKSCVLTAFLIIFKICQRNELRSIRPGCFNCPNGAKQTPLPELKVNGPGGCIWTPKPSGDVIN